MAHTRTQGLIADALADLSQEDMDRFTRVLLEPRGDGVKPDSFRVAHVMDKTNVQLGRLLHNALSDKAVEITLRLLRKVNINHAANKLEASVRLPPTPTWDNSRTYSFLSTSEDCGQRKPESPKEKSEPPPASVEPVKESSAVKEGHFVERYQERIARHIYNTPPIHEYLVKEGVLEQEVVDRIADIRPRSDQTRFLYGEPMKSGGERFKDVFMTALCIFEPYLMQDLWKEEEGSS